MMMLCQMSNKMRHGKIKSDIIKEGVEIAPIVKKKFRQFVHAERRLVDDVVRRVDQIEDSRIKRGREIFGKTILETIRKD